MYGGSFPSIFWLSSSGSQIWQNFMSGSTLLWNNGARNNFSINNANGAGISMDGATSGTVTLTPPATAGGNLQLPPGTDTVAGIAATQPLTNKTLNVPLTSGTGLQIFNTTTTCTTAASVGATCTTAAITLPVAEADTAYRVVCTGKGLTAVPVVIATTNSSATQFTITIAALTAVAASFASYDCLVGHN